jgi:hypothetical protein
MLLLKVLVLLRFINDLIVMSFEFKSIKCWITGICAVEWYALNWNGQAVFEVVYKFFIICQQSFSNIE